MSRSRPKRCGVCDFGVLGPVGKLWVWCFRCGSLGNGTEPGEWTEPDPNAVEGRPLRALPQLRVVQENELQAVSVAVAEHLVKDPASDERR